MDRATVLDLMRQILQKQGKPADITEEALLQEIGFRSLDFSELALRIETASGRQLDRTVRDVLDFMERAYLGKDRRNESGQS